MRLQAPRGVRAQQRGGAEAAAPAASGSAYSLTRLPAAAPPAAGIWPPCMPPHTARWRVLTTRCALQGAGPARGHAVSSWHGCARRHAACLHACLLSPCPPLPSRPVRLSAPHPARMCPPPAGVPRQRHHKRRGVVSHLWLHAGLELPGRGLPGADTGAQVGWAGWLPCALLGAQDWRPAAASAVPPRLTAPPRHCLRPAPQPEQVARRGGAGRSLARQPRRPARLPAGGSLRRVRACCCPRAGAWCCRRR